MGTEISEPTRTHSNQQETERDRKLNLERWRFYSIPFLTLTTLSSDTLCTFFLRIKEEAVRARKHGEEAAVAKDRLAGGGGEQGRRRKPRQGPEKGKILPVFHENGSSTRR